MKTYILGAGGFAREVAVCAQQAGMKISGFINVNPGPSLHDLPVLVASDIREKTIGVLNGIGHPDLRETAVEDLLQHYAGNAEFPTLVHPNVVLSDSVRLGKGVILCAGSVLTCDITIGDFTYVNLGSTIGHDADLGRYCAVSTSVSVSGRVSVGDSCYLGTGARILENRIIGKHAVVGAGSLVTRNVEDNTTVLGVPARVIFRTDGGT